MRYPRPDCRHHDPVDHRTPPPPPPVPSSAPYPPPPPPRPPQPFQPCRPDYYYPHVYYKYATVAVLCCGTIALLLIFWRYCRKRSKPEEGRVIVQPPPPPPPQPFKPSPPPYTPDDFPPPYHVCVPEDSLPPQSNSTGRPQPTVPGYHTGSSAGNASAPPPKSPPLPEKPHVVHVPAGSRDGY
ncbi:hypothetical protein NQ315_007267 [Exocentrus adspersus]|uniref:Uncharacterized protein n=1 Tax=Exocentrus adspersus TaxID=1586481 RepID=A0AAV8WEH9_9CUCU|nr:hypothetical protein NQ315_007267 [Exocentrus adspersus]